MSGKPSFFAELKRRNVIRAAVFYVGAVWALTQGIAQLTPVVGAPEWVARWFLVAACIGFPFWLAFAWFYEFTPEGLKQRSPDGAQRNPGSCGERPHFAAAVKKITFREPTAGRARLCVAIPDSAALHPGYVATSRTTPSHLHGRAPHRARP